MKGFARFPTPFIYIYFFHFPYERVRKTLKPFITLHPSYPSSEIPMLRKSLPETSHRWESSERQNYIFLILCTRVHKLEKNVQSTAQNHLRNLFTRVHIFFKISTDICPLEWTFSERCHRFNDPLGECLHIKILQITTKKY